MLPPHGVWVTEASACLTAGCVRLSGRDTDATLLRRRVPDMSGRLQDRLLQLPQARVSGQTVATSGDTKVHRSGLNLH